MHEENEPQYDPLYPIECLESHLKKVVFKSFQGYRRQVEFARFFVLNAKVLDKIEFEVRNQYSSETVAYEHRLLQVEDRASRDAEPEFRSEFSCLGKTKQIHDLLDNPFDCSCSRIKCNVLSGEACP